MESQEKKGAARGIVEEHADEHSPDLHSEWRAAFCLGYLSSSIMLPEATLGGLAALSSDEAELSDLQRALRSCLLEVAEAIPRNLYTVLMDARQRLENIRDSVFTDPDGEDVLAVLRNDESVRRSARDVRHRLSQDEEFMRQAGEAFSRMTDAELTKIIDGLLEWRRTSDLLKEAADKAFRQRPDLEKWYRFGRVLGEHHAMCQVEFEIQRDDLDDVRAAFLDLPEEVRETILLAVNRSAARLPGESFSNIAKFCQYLSGKDDQPSVARSDYESVLIALMVWFIYYPRRHLGTTPGADKEVAVAEPTQGETSAAADTSKEWQPGYLGLELDEDLRQVRRGQVEVDLLHQDLSWAILRELVERGNRPLSKNSLKDVWEENGYDDNPLDSTVVSQISDLRDALRPLDVGIKAVRRVGYRLVDGAAPKPKRRAKKG